MTTIVYEPRGVCARLMEAKLENGRVVSLTVTGGCSGNSQGICRLVAGMSVAEIIVRLEGIDCKGKGTSCPDQLARLLKTHKI